MVLLKGFALKGFAVLLEIDACGGIYLEVMMAPPSPPASSRVMHREDREQIKGRGGLGSKEAQRVNSREQRVYTH